MILEYADGGTLFDKLRSEVLPKPDIKAYFKDVCEAIAYLHEHEIMHRDIKVSSCFYWSLKIFYLPVRIKLSYVILALLLF